MIHITLFFKRFGLAIAISELCRLLFLLFNLNVFSQYTFLNLASAFYFGLLFDISAFVYLNILFIVLSIHPFNIKENPIYQSILKMLFIFTNGIGIFLNVIDFGYFHFSSKRTGSEILQSGNDIKPLLFRYLTDYWYLALICIALLWLLWKFYPALNSEFTKDKRKKTLNFFRESIAFILVIGFSIIGARGGFYLKPIRPFDAARFMQPELVPLTLNTPFVVLTTYENPKPEALHYMPDDEALKIFNPEQQYASLKMKKMNVVIIILESFGKEYIGYFNKGKGYTPFLDSLCGNSMVFTNAHANGKHSIEAVPSILSSMPSLLEMPYIDSYFQENHISSIGKILHDEGYSTGFYHGAYNGSMGFDNFIHLSGFGPYYGLNEFTGNKKISGEWGVPDEPYLQYLSQELDKKAKPFCVAVFTLSSHHPYTIPEEYKTVFPEGTIPIHKSIRYADFALRKFFASASTKEWYKNTVFVITADHSADNEQEKYKTMDGRYAIPIIFFRGDSSIKGNNAKTVSQIDIMPGILQYLGYNKKFTAFGRSPFDSTYQGIAIQYETGTYQYIHTPDVLHFNGKNEFSYYQNPPDTFLRKDIKSRNAVKDNSERNLKAFLQVFHKYLNENRLENKR